MPAKKKEWFKRGKDGEEKADQISQEQAKGTSARFWLKPDNSTKMTLLDTDGFYFYEHNLFLNGKWNNFFTCLQDFDNCPLCEAGHKPYYACAFTIVDHSEYESKAQGKRVKNQRKLLVMKKRALEKLKRRRDSAKLGGDLTHAVFEVARNSSDEANTGEDFDFLKRLEKKTLAKLAPKELKTKDEVAEWMKPFDYPNLFEPKPAEVLQRIAGTSAPVGSDADSTSKSRETEEPAASDDDLEKYL